MVGCSDDAAKIAESLGKRPKNHEAHHIVMSNSNDWRMKELRDMMDNFNIDINSKNNGIWLPKTSADRLPNSLKTAHKGNGIYGKAYKQFVYDKLISSKNPKEFEAGLKEIKSYLSSGNVFPLSNGKFPTC
ncbi:AHH domain-containing protein [Pasteurella sp. PK-2025]|uniref:AHH domain-containing protein n=1 Tax=Pasteurella sp. PK-2025 TaxID=3413133 RepID=UPI003C745C62